MKGISKKIRILLVVILILVLGAGYLIWGNLAPENAMFSLISHSNGVVNAEDRLQENDQWNQVIKVQEDNESKQTEEKASYEIASDQQELTAEEMSDVEEDISEEISTVEDDTISESITDLQLSIGQVDYFVGDSRFLGMAKAIDGMEEAIHGGSEEAELISGKWIAKVGAGYTWYQDYALPALTQRLQLNRDATVVLNFGVNDLGSIDSYIASYQTLIEKFPSAKIYILSVNPTSMNYEYMNADIMAFNARMQATFPDHYIDTFTRLRAEGFDSADGLHYKPDKYIEIYSMIIEAPATL